MFYLFSVPATAVEQDILTRVAPTLPLTIDPQGHSVDSHRIIYSDLFTGLTTRSADGSIIAGVAQSWTISDDGKIYKFKIRKDAFWSDGRPVTALDFVLAFKRLFALGAKLKLSNSYEFIEDSDAYSKGGLAITPEYLRAPSMGVVAIDARTVQFRLIQPLPYFLSLLANPQASPVPHHHYAIHGEDWTSMAKSLGNGPYQLDGIQPNSYLILRKNPFFYAAEKVAIEAVRYSLLPKDWTLGRMMFSGKADLSYSLPHFQIDAGYKADGFTLHKTPHLSLYNFVLNQGSDSLKDVSVRKALYLSINRPQLLEAINNYYDAVEGLVPPMTNYVSPIKSPLMKRQSNKPEN